MPDPATEPLRPTRARTIEAYERAHRNRSGVLEAVRAQITAIAERSLDS
jgi:hypothetical protein